MATAAVIQKPMYLTPAETADELRISDRHLRELTRTGAVPCVRLSQRVVRYRRDQIEQISGAGCTTSCSAAAGERENIGKMG